ncbi:MAG: hypothetical protein JSR31_16655 [Nitrospira sp.]|nr:hypothetical protein [Nitrospira sp.]
MLWRQAWDAAFTISSFPGDGLRYEVGKLIRGVSLKSREKISSFRTRPIFQPGSISGILDWFTVLLGLTSVVLLAFHRANCLAVEIEGILYQQAVEAIKILW